MKKEVFAQLFVCLLALLVLAFWFQEAFWHPSKYYVGYGGDVMHSYYAMEHFIRFGAQDSYMLKAYSYPQGIHLLCADVNPFLSIVLRWVNHNLFSIQDIPTLMTKITYFSLMLCAWLSYLTLRKNLLPIRWAIPFSILIMLLSPQMLRVGAHPNLAFAFFPPLYWYLNIRLTQDRNKWAWIIALFFAIGIGGMVHMYFFLIGAFFTSTYLLIFMHQNRRNFPDKSLTFFFKNPCNRLFFAAIISSLSPIFFINLWFKHSNTGGDDFVHTWGFGHYRSSFETLFLPLVETSTFKVLGKILAALHITLFEGEWEGNAYVGVLGFLLLIYTVSRTTQLIRTKQWHKITHPVVPTPLRIGLWAILPLLLVAMTIPFRQFPVLLELLPIIKQFRSTGRLAWMFYFVWTNAAVCLLYLLMRKLQMRKPSLQWLGYSFIVLICSIWIFEAWQQTTNIRSAWKIDRNKTENAHIDWSKVLAQSGHKAEEFQAVMTLPFIHTGSSKLSLGGSYFGYIYMHILALETGLPLMNNVSGRAAISDMTSSVQWVSHPYIEKSLFTKFPNDKPILLLYKEDEIDNEVEKKLIADAKVFYQNETIRLAILPISTWKSQQQTLIAAFQQEQNTFYSQGELKLSSPCKSVIAEGFGDKHFEHPFSEQHTFFTKEGENIVWEKEITADSLPHPMELSFWVRLDKASNLLDSALLYQYKGDVFVAKDAFRMCETRDVYKNWARISLPFWLTESENRVRLVIRQPQLYIDNLMVKPRNLNVYSGIQGKQSFVLDNYPVGQ